LLERLPVRFNLILLETSPAAKLFQKTKQLVRFTFKLGGLVQKRFRLSSRILICRVLSNLGGRPLQHWRTSGRVCGRMESFGITPTLSDPPSGNPPRGPHRQAGGNQNRDRRHGQRGELPPACYATVWRSRRVPAPTRYTGREKASTPLLPAPKGGYVIRFTQLFRLGPGRARSGCVPGSGTILGFRASDRRCEEPPWDGQ